MSDLKALLERADRAVSDVPLPAHSLAEAKLYLLATGCPSCAHGPVRSESQSDVSSNGGWTETLVHARCDACSRARCRGERTLDRRSR